MTNMAFLGDLVDITSSKRIFYKEYETSGVPFYRSKEIIEKAAGKRDITTELFISDERFDEIEKKFGAPKEGDMLLTSVGTLGIPYIVKKNEKFYFKDGNLTWFRNFKPDLDRTYLMYWLTSAEGKNALAQQTIGSTQKALTIQGLKKVKIPLPDIVVQTKIAEMLSRIDEKIDLNYRMSETLSHAGHTLFNHFFVNNPELSSWKAATADELFRLTMGLSPKGESYNVIGDGLPLLNGAGDFDGASINPSRHTSAPTRISKPGDIIFCIRGTIGNVCIGYSQYCLGRGVAAMTPSINATSYVYFSTLLAIKELDSAASGSVIRGLSKDDIAKRKIMLPPLNILQEFEEVALPIIDKLRVNSEESLTLNTLRSSLLPRLISGKIVL